MIRQRKEEYIMNMDERIKRINELYHKSQSEGLTDERKAGTVHSQTGIRGQHQAQYEGAAGQHRNRKAGRHH